MVILYLYDRVNDYRYRKISYDYYIKQVPKNADYIVSAWLVPNTQDLWS